MMRHPEEAAPRRTLLTSLTSWLDAGAGLANFDSAKIDHIDWMRVVPFIGMHLACFEMRLRANQVAGRDGAIIGPECGDA